MHKFTHLESLYQVRREASRRGLGRVRYRGTVKLHGSNAGVVVHPDGRITPQSRNRELELGSDHMGFAAFALAHRAAILRRAAWLRAVAHLAADREIVMFGEWIGPGIQRGVALAKLPARQWVIFAAGIVPRGDPDAAATPEIRYVDPNALKEALRRAALHEDLGSPLCSIYEGPTWDLEIDFLDPAAIETAAAEVERLTAPVDARCPWGALYEVEGPGEGIVWAPVGDYRGDLGLAFKSKGPTHREVGPRPAAAPTDHAAAVAFAARWAQPARLDKGLDYLREQGLPLAPPSIGAFLEWVSRDILREAAAELAEEGAPLWKAIAPSITRIARAHVLRAIRDAAEG